MQFLKTLNCYHAKGFELKYMFFNAKIHKQNLCDYCLKIDILIYYEKSLISIFKFRFYYFPILQKLL